MPYDKALGTFFIRRRVKIPHQPFLLDFIRFSVLSLILGNLKRAGIYHLAKKNIIVYNFPILKTLGGVKHVLHSKGLFKTYRNRGL
ncbi:MAG TPA: hypothetical protein HPP56_10480 [Nitrospirae bacterium]|nr:hypothetical protein [Nitrospirota bacterium]